MLSRELEEKLREKCIKEHHDLGKAVWDIEGRYIKYGAQALSELLIEELDERIAELENRQGQHKIGSIVHSFDSIRISELKNFKTLLTGGK